MITKFNWHLAAVFIIPLLVYFFSMPLSVALEDDGLFIMSSYFNGVSHPPGYPLHSFIGKLFTLIPVSTIPARVHAVSAFFGALSCVMLWLLIHDLLQDKLIAYVGAFSYAFSLTFWSQAIIAEVYTLNSFFFFSLVYLLLKINSFSSSASASALNQLIYFTAFVFGLSLCNHWPLMILSSPCLFILLWPKLRVDPSILIKSIPFIFLGLLPYVWMVLNSQTNPVISFTGPIDSWQEFIDFIARKRYANIDTSSSAGITDKLLFSSFYLQELVRQFAYPGAVFVVIGLYAQFKYFKRNFIYATFAAFFANSFLLIFLLDFDFELIKRSIISVYFLISYGVASLWLSVGIYHSYAFITKHELTFVKKFFIPLCSLYLIIVFFQNLSINDRHDYDWGIKYASAVLRSLPEDAVIIVNDDISTGTIGYTSLVEKIRPDISLISGKALVFRNRLYDPSELNIDEAAPILEKYIHRKSRPVYTTSTDTSIYPNDHWLTRSYSKDIPAGQQVMHISALDKNYLRYIYEQGSKNDIWTNFHRSQLLRSSVPFVVETKLRGDTDVLLDNIILEITNDMDGLLLFIYYLKNRHALDRFGGLNNLLLKAESLYTGSLEKTQKADYLRFRALIEKNQGNQTNFEQYLIKSLLVWPNDNNMSFDMLAELYKSDGRELEYNAFIEGFSTSIIEKYQLSPK